MHPGSSGPDLRGKCIDGLAVRSPVRHSIVNRGRHVAMPPFHRMTSSTRRTDVLTLALLWFMSRRSRDDFSIVRPPDRKGLETQTFPALTLAPNRAGGNRRDRGCPGLTVRSARPTLGQGFAPLARAEKGTMP